MARITHGMFLIAVTCVVILGTAGCGGAASESSEPTVPAEATTTTIATADAAAAAAVKEMSDYTDALKAWFRDYAELAESEGNTAFEFADAEQPTDSEMARAREFLDSLRSSVADLKEISVPAEVAEAHSQLRSALSGELTAVERLVNAIDWESWRDAELAFRQLDEAYALYIQAEKSLGEYVDLTGVIQN